MAADVSSMVNSTSNSEILITRDLLGEFSKVGNKDLDLDLQVSKSWDIPPDLKSAGMVCSQQACNSANPPLSSFNKKQKTTQESEFRKPKHRPLKFLEESSLELKLVPSSQYCQSVCTLDKVKSALQRAGQETIIKKRSPPPPSPLKEDENSSTSTSLSSSSGLFAAACPGCMLYVMTSKTNPKCPSCNSSVPSPLGMKKPRIDLNASFDL